VVYVRKNTNIVSLVAAARENAHGYKYFLCEYCGMDG